MADLFGGVQSPKWMSLDERQALYEQMAGEETAGFAQAFNNAFSQAQEANSAMGKAKLTAAQSDAKIKQLTAEEETKDHQKWMAEADSVIKWAALPYDQRQKAERPTVQSKKGLDAILSVEQSDNTYALKKQQQENLNAYRQNMMNMQEWKAKHGVQFMKQQNEFEEGLLRLTPARQAVIEKAVKDANGEFRDEGGFFTPEARAAIANALVADGLPGIGEIEKAKAVEGVKEANREKMEGVKTEKKKSLLEYEAQLKTQLERVKADLKSEKSKTLSLDDFIQRHYNTIYSALLRNNTRMDPNIASQTTRQVLTKTFKSMHPEGEKPKTEAPAAKAATPTSAGTTNAPASEANYDDFLNWTKGK